MKYYLNGTVIKIKRKSNIITVKVKFLHLQNTFNHVSLFKDGDLINKSFVISVIKYNICNIVDGGLNLGGCKVYDVERSFKNKDDAKKWVSNFEHCYKYGEKDLPTYIKSIGGIA